MRYSIILILGFLIPSSPPDPSATLYVIENKDSGQGVADKQDLVRVSIDDKGKLSKEVILSEASGFLPYFGHKATILQGRFIVSENGGVIDVKEKRVIHNEPNGKYLGFDDGKIFYRHRTFEGVASSFDIVSSFDIRASKVDNKITGQHWNLPGQKSPDKKMSVDHVGTSGPIKLHRIGKPPVDLGDQFGFKYSGFANPSLQEGVPCLWLTADRILTIQSSQKLVTVDLQGKVEQFCEIKDAPAEVITPPRLWIDPAGRVIYSSGGGSNFLIDVPAKTASALTNYSLGHKFEASVAEDNQFKRTVYYDGKEIGKWRHPTYRCKTAPGLIALAYHKAEDELILDDSEGGVAIWSEKSRQWQTISMWTESLTGWSE